MVGVPRSKACNTCRVRKIACTQERPHCKQCLKSSRICTGYQRDRIFITSQGTPGEGASPSKSPRRSRSFESGDSERTYLIPYSGREGNHGRIVRGQATPIRLLRDISPHWTYRRQLFDLFVCSHIPIDMRKPSREHQGRIWLLALQELPSWTKALEASVLSFSIARLGRLNDDAVLVRESLRLYSKGLAELQKALWDPHLMRHDETLAACFALSLYEITECASESGQGYISHHNGCAKLIQLRGAEAHTSGLGHHIFTAFRIQGIVQALAVHQSTFLTDSPWTDSPWKNISKTPYDTLLGLLALTPDIMKQLDELKRGESNKVHATALELIDRCWKLDADLERWYKELEEQTPGPLYWSQFSTDAELSNLFPVILHFVDLAIAHILSLYWATLVILWKAMCDLYTIASTTPDDETTCKPSVLDLVDEVRNSEEASRIASSIFDVSDLRPLEHRLDWSNSAAKSICQATEYCMQEEMLALGPASLAPPIMIVAENLKMWPGDWSRHLLWIRTVLVRAHGRGNRLLKFFNRKQMIEYQED